MDQAELRIGGLPVVTLRSDDLEGVVEAVIAPGRGMMLLQARGRIGGGEARDLLASPALSEIPAILDGGPDDFSGNGSFSLGGAILLPYANRIRGRALATARAIEVDLDGTTVRLPRNWGGRAPEAEQYAMHGMMLDLAFADVLVSHDLVRGRVTGHDFGGRWPSRLDIEVTWRLVGGCLDLTVLAENVGLEPTPLGIGWHPYFKIQSGQRAQARLRLPAARRLLVNDYDEVLPTGAVVPVSGSDYDFTGPEGRALGDRHFDDCFVDYGQGAGDTPKITIADPAGGCEIGLRTSGPEVRAVQVYAPRDPAILVVEPQFNWPDPFGGVWSEDEATGMVWLNPGERALYKVTTSLRALP